jgi:transcriptional regulator with XRE-family HTH domain
MKGPIDSKIAHRLREVRKAAAVTQIELGRRLGVTQGLIEHYENARSRIPTDRLEAIAAALHCDVKQLHDPPGSPIIWRFRPPAWPTEARPANITPGWIPTKSLPLIINYDAFLDTFTSRL